MKKNNVGAATVSARQENKGITLIALIITIIIMLILVGVTVAILINSNMIGIAQDTADKTKTAYEEESNINEITVGKKPYGSIEDIVEGKMQIQAGETAKDGNASYKGVTIPEGFTVSKIDGEYEDVSKGLVIYDIPEADLKDSTKVDWTKPDTVKTKYNQFVWIPVAVNKTVEPVDTEESIASFRRSDWEDSSSGGTRGKDIPNDGTSYYTEPYAYDDTNDYDGADGTGIKAQIAELTKSIYKYEGFYIARYEAGSTTERTKDSSQTAPFVIQQDKYPYNYVAWGASVRDISTGGAVYLSNNLYPSTNSKYGATSILCTGACWDAVLDFMKDSSHNVKSSSSWGNYYDSETYKVKRGCYANYVNPTLGSFLYMPANGIDVTKKKEILLTTGATERNSSKNIYDIAGNCREWTTEACDSTRRVMRGGEFTQDGDNGPACSRIQSYPWLAIFGETSFRPALYIK